MKLSKEMEELGNEASQVIQFCRKELKLGPADTAAVLLLTVSIAHSICDRKERDEIENVARAILARMYDAPDGQRLRERVKEIHRQRAEGKT